MKKLLLAILLLFSPVTIYADDLEKDTALQVLESTVKIKTRGSQGSGIILWSGDSDDSRVNLTYIITNKHVVKRSKTCKVVKYLFLKQRNTIGNTEYSASVAFVSSQHDLALIEIKTPPSVEFTETDIVSERTWDHMTLFDKVYLSSCGLGATPSITGGNLSSVNVDETEMSFTANVIYGSSGGGVFNSDGELVGICNAIKIYRGHPISHKALGIPITTVIDVIRQSKYRFILGEVYEDALDDELEELPDDWDLPDYWEDEDSIPAPKKKAKPKKFW